MFTILYNAMYAHLVPVIWECLLYFILLGMLTLWQCPWNVYYAIYCWVCSPCASVHGMFTILYNARYAHLVPVLGMFTILYTAGYAYLVPVSIECLLYYIVLGMLTLC